MQRSTNGRVTVDQLRTLRETAETAKRSHGEHSPEHLAAWQAYVDAAHRSTTAMLKAVYVEVTSPDH